MTALVLAVRPRPRRASVSRPRSSRPSWTVPAVTIGWDGLGSLHIAHCGRCAESSASTRLGEVDDWADSHRCDAELAALLAEITARRTA
ncbi:hypothetical protein [Actinomadura sp. 9N407]|uniref:hypothetical protein n=1 Tax=Actinomadura sp. 9N407 TaxID=3375154 RepID=UPI0037A7F7D3